MSLPKIPPFLEQYPSSTIDPPVDTKLQILPFDKLTWQDFERLCLRLARLDAEVEYCTLYGNQGNDQDGIDLYAR